MGYLMGGEYQKQGNRADLWKILGFTMAGAYDNEDSSMIPRFHTSPRLQLPASTSREQGAFVNTRLVKRLQEKHTRGLLQGACGMQKKCFCTYSKHVRVVATGGNPWGPAGGTNPPTTPPYGGAVTENALHNSARRRNTPSKHCYSNGMGVPILPLQENTAVTSRSTPQNKSLGHAWYCSGVCKK